jgi:glyoxylase-like metal-dependent hydrolase (beta-lactamase superfamily II)
VAKLGIVKIRLDREVNAYLVSAGRDAMLIDPGLPSEKLIAQLRDLQLRWIVMTHGHPGHVAGKDDLKAAAGGQTAMHIADAKQFLRSADQYVVDGDELDVGDLTVKVLHTPGHTPGSLCLLLGNHLFTGDTLLPGLPPRELPGSNLRQQVMSIGSRILNLPPTTAMYPGHGPTTSLANEVATNPLFARVG